MRVTEWKADNDGMGRLSIAVAAPVSLSGCNLRRACCMPFVRKLTVHLWFVIHSTNQSNTFKNSWISFFHIQNWIGLIIGYQTKESQFGDVLVTHWAHKLRRRKSTLVSLLGLGQLDMSLPTVFLQIRTTSWTKRQKMADTDASRDGLPHRPEGL